MPAKKQITRDMILSTAFDMLRTGGMESINVKELAEKIQTVLHNRYIFSFTSMDMLRTELSSVAVETFLRQIQSNSTTADFYGIAYIRFAEEEKKLFQFLFMRQNAFSELREALIPIMDDSIARLMEQYNISREEAHYFHDQLWVHAHGIASMIATDFCDWKMDKVENMLTESVLYLSRKYGEENVFK